uniref:Uncharacterized protein n=1 Tax=Anguilla anguilla TaxID=7936 RepID=A0A0E9WX95_ANGAN
MICPGIPSRKLKLGTKASLNKTVIHNIHHYPPRNGCCSKIFCNGLHILKSCSQSKGLKDLERKCGGKVRGGIILVKDRVHNVLIFL